MPAPARYLRDVAGVDAIESEHPEQAIAELPPSRAVVMWHVIEHLRRPWEVIERAAANLLDGGVLAIATPNPAAAAVQAARPALGASRRAAPPVPDPSRHARRSLLAAAPATGLHDDQRRRRATLEPVRLAVRAAPRSAQPTRDPAERDQLGRDHARAEPDRDARPERLRLRVDLRQAAAAVSADASEAAVRRREAP